MKNVRETLKRQTKALKVRTSSINTTQRIDFLKKLCKDKKVLHLGCADFPYTAKKFYSNSLLFQIIDEVASSQVGIDNSKEGVEFLNIHGIERVHLGDIESLQRVFSQEQFDIILAGEIIEHISNCGLFLQSIADVIGDGQLVITTPNAYCGFRFLYHFFHLGNEYVHPDHVYNFSRRTLISLIQRFNFKVIDFKYYAIGNELLPIINVPWYFLILDKLSYFPAPFIADGMILVAKRVN